METTMTLESLANELAKLLADFIHSLVSSKLEKMADRIRGSSLRCDRPLAIVELGSSGEPLARLLTVLNETLLRVGPLELDSSIGLRSEATVAAICGLSQSPTRTLRKGELP
jgi:hypothetical protein